LKDLYLLDVSLNNLSTRGKYVIGFDTHAANIPYFAGELKNRLGDEALVIEIGEKRLNRVIFEFSFIFFSLKMILRNVFKVQAYRGFCTCIFYDFLHLTQNSHRIKLKNTHAIVFYEKSILSMYLKLSAKNFIVIQHGMPSETYFPSVADRYIVWNRYFKESVSKHFEGEVIVGGYLGDNTPILNSKYKFDILFVSQRGSNDELRKKCIVVKEKINKLARSGKKILVKLHPSESEADFQYHESIEIYCGDSLEDAAALCNVACSFYSTALYLLGMRGIPIYRINAEPGDLGNSFLANVPEYTLQNLSSVQKIFSRSSHSLPKFDINSLRMTT
jgi:hypothetical protein